MRASHTGADVLTCTLCADIDGKVTGCKITIVVTFRVLYHSQLCVSWLTDLSCNRCSMDPVPLREILGRMTWRMMYYGGLHLFLCCELGAQSANSQACLDSVHSVTIIGQISGNTYSKHSQALVFQQGFKSLYNVDLETSFQTLKLR